MNRISLLISALTLSASALAVTPGKIDVTGTVSNVISERELVITDQQGEIHVFKDARIGGSYFVGDTIRVSAKHTTDWLKLNDREIIAASIVKLATVRLTSQAAP